ncbi:MAG: SMI1/KNR4 family protein [Fimbriimonadaceae bacterium]|nr:SMI1/KNR4 family protein [Fimbriimonadaceae bacterium]
MKTLAEKIIEPLDLAISLSAINSIEHLKPYYGPPLTDRMIAVAEQKLGLQLPHSYLEFCRVVNGGFVRGEFFVINACEVSFRSISGIGYENGIDSDTGSAYMIEEWDYPSPGIVLGGDGHTAVMLDYRKSFDSGEPPVIWVDTEEVRVVTIANNFTEFAQILSSLIEGK